MGEPASSDERYRPVCGRTFHSDELQRAFDRQGFVVVPLIDEATVARVRSAVLRLCDGATGLVDPTDLASAERVAVDRLVLDELSDAASRYLVDHDLFLGTQFVKQPGAGSEKAFHMDWSVVDESRDVGGVIWVALDDSTAANGGLRAVPGTNRIRAPHRGSPDAHFPVGGTPFGEALDELAVDVDVPAGHAAIFDHQLLHSSHPNRTDRARVAVGIGFKPRAAELLHYRVDADGTTHRFEIDPRFLLEFGASGDIPLHHARSHEILPDRPWDLELADLAVLSAPAPERTPRPVAGGG